jgi:hypothetical protein
MLLSFIAVSCRQDSIFFTIASETSPLKPRIEGSPTNIVVFERKYPGRDEPVPVMYVASGRLHWYMNGDNGPQWDLKEYAIPQPGGKISALAVTKDAVAGSRLYALCRDGHGINSTLRYIESNGTEWKTIPPGGTAYPVIQSIFADSESTRLFAGAGKNDQSQATYGILYLDHDTLKLLKSDTSLLTGAVYHEAAYYLSTRGDGIFQVSESALAANVINENTVQQLNDNSSIEEKDQRKTRTFMSMIKLEDTIIAVERNGGTLYAVHSGSFARMRYPDNTDWIATGRYATEAHVLWSDPERGLKLFINGIQGGLFYTTTSSQIHGYVEFELGADGNTIITRHDSGRLLSVHDNDRYKASIGKHPINHLFQAPDTIDPNMTFFASTQNNGLWSYRDRPSNGGWQWNAEN